MTAARITRLGKPGRTLFIVVAIDDEGGEPARIYPDYPAARDAVMAYLSGPENEPVLTAEETAVLRHSLDGPPPEAPLVLRGSSQWTERIVIAPVTENLPPQERQEV